MAWVVQGRFLEEGTTGAGRCATARQGRRNIPGVDIVQEKRAAREETKAAEIEAKAPTFEQCAEAYITAHSSTWARNIVTNGPRP